MGSPDTCSKWRSDHQQLEHLWIGVQVWTVNNSAYKSCPNVLRHVHITLYSFHTSCCAANFQVCRQVLRHEEIGQVYQRVPSGRQLPVQHCYHTCLITSNVALWNNLWQVQRSGNNNGWGNCTSVGWNIRFSSRKSPWTSVTSSSSSGKLFMNQSDSEFMAGMSRWAAAVYCFVQVETFQFNSIKFPSVSFSSKQTSP